MKLLNNLSPQNPLLLKKQIENESSFDQNKNKNQPVQNHIFAQKEFAKKNNHHVSGHIGLS